MLRDHLSFVYSHRELMHFKSVLTEPSLQNPYRHSAQVFKSTDVEARKGLLGHFPHAPHFLYGKRVQELPYLIRGHHGQAIGLVHIRSDLSHKLGRSHTSRNRQTGLIHHHLLDLLRNFHWFAKKPDRAGNIKKRLIYGEGLHQRSETKKYLEYLFGNLLVPRHPTRQKHPVRAEAHGCCHGLGRMDTEFARLIRRRRNNTPFPAAAHNNRLTLQSRIIQNLDRRIKGIHVQVNNCS